MKPHEETWAVLKSDAGGWVASHNGDGPIVVTVMGNTIAQQKERAALVAGAPEMARALLGVLQQDGHTTMCLSAQVVGEACEPHCSAVRAVLAKAGVLP